MRGNGWGALPASTQNTSFNASPLPAYDSGLADLYFSDGTGDELNCINNHEGAIGYADADKVSVTGTCPSCTVDYTTVVSGTTTYSNMKEIKYQGEYAAADAIKNGRYDFWTNEWAYYDGTYVSGISGLTNLLTKTTAPKGILSYVTGNIPNGELPFWADQADVTFEKGTDQAYPQR